MSEVPLVSIAMPAFNCAHTLAQSIESVLAQSLSDWELIVVDDGSADDTVVIAERYAMRDSRIRVVRSTQPSGSPAIPRNRAMALSRGRYQAFLDADDLWLPDKLQSQILWMQKHDIALSCTGYYAFQSEDGRNLGALIPPASTGYSGLLRANIAGCLTVVFNRELTGVRFFPRCGHEDYALWLELLREGFLMEGLPQVLAGYRVSEGSASSSKLRNLRFFWYVYRHRENFGMLGSAFFCLRYAFGAARKYRRKPDAQ
jgi:teichuronic acid biosynthesis glycosyltransferase TuaG